MESHESNIEQKLTDLTRQIHALDEKLNVILDFCLKQNGMTQELKSDINGLKEEVKSMKMLSIMNHDARAEHAGVVTTGGFATAGMPQLNVSAPTAQRSVCPECGAVDQMEQIKDTIYDEHGHVLRADAPALECQICGEIVHL
ncbi:hypothetical protein [Paenibacillus guangzhouensis]|uniref:hypothetical protein n=1 Tax=Paenibacillus guangzhouensis TaxID=1473112 RepID=UPI00126689CF|nr:hypothetical protein [Paenibacillus guangzhouensis]